jgi:hypothetical protein
LVSARTTVTVAIFARNISIKIVVRMLYRGDFYIAGGQFGDQFFGKRGFAAA